MLLSTQQQILLLSRGRRKLFPAVDHWETRRHVPVVALPSEHDDKLLEPLTLDPAQRASAFDVHISIHAHWQIERGHRCQPHT